MSCVASGSPEPYLAWLSPAGAVLQNRTKPSDTNLTISSASRNDIGVYTCVASNPHGEERRQTTVICELNHQCEYIVWHAIVTEILTLNKVLLNILGFRNELKFNQHNALF